MFVLIFSGRLLSQKGIIEVEGGGKMYSTYQIRIKKGHRFYHYCDEMCFNAKNLFNTTNFYIRQIFTAFNNEKRHELQKEIVELIDFHLPEMNQVKAKYAKKGSKRNLKNLNMNEKK